MPARKQRLCCCKSRITIHTSLVTLTRRKVALSGAADAGAKAPSKLKLAKSGARKPKRSLEEPLASPEIVIVQRMRSMSPAPVQRSPTKQPPASQPFLPIYTPFFKVNEACCALVLITCSSQPDTYDGELCNHQMAARFESRRKWNSCWQRNILHKNYSCRNVRWFVLGSFGDRRRVDTSQ